MPMWRSMRGGGVRLLSLRGSLLRFIFQNRANPGLDMLSLEIFGSLGTEEERWASPPLVLHSAAPRPNWACATPRHRNAQANEAAGVTKLLRMTKILSTFKGNL